MDTLIGRKLKELREVNGYTQEEVSRITGINRSKLSQVENGKMGISNEELYKISRLLGQPLEYFFEEEESPVRNVLLFKAKNSLDEEDLELVKNCQEIGINYTELEELVSEEEVHPDFRTYSYPPDVPFYRVAKAIARKERQFLELNPSDPVPLRSILQEQGILVLEISFKSDILDGFFFIHDKRPVIIANAHNKNPFSRNFVIAHELAHVLMDSSSLSRFCNSIEESEEVVEKRANFFSNEFLLPEETLEIYFAECGYKKGESKIQKYDLYYLMDHYQLSREIVLNRLLFTGWISEDERGNFLEIEGIVRDMERMGFSNEYTRYYSERKEDQKFSEYPIFNMLTERYRFLAKTAYTKSKITFGKLSEYLFLPKDQIATLFGIGKKEPTVEEVLGLS
jgi:Zn-dependent peptidase ImmA (M78 family)/transcriptional regulator with XRE-family HTH domain